MTAPIQQLFTICKQILRKTPFEELSKEILSPIISSVNKLTHHDICFNPVEFKEEESRKKKRAPVSYMELYHDNDFSMAVFIVKEGSSLPLHDHHDMFGLLKLIHGSIKIVSYDDSESHQDVYHEVEDASDYSYSVQRFRAVTKNPEKLISSNDDCCVLTPVEGNLHAIHPVTEFAVFLDILTPSYGPSRPCHYWKEVETNDTKNPNIKWLLQIPDPEHYWCDRAPYRGPKLE